MQVDSDSSDRSENIGLNHQSDKEDYTALIEGANTPPQKKEEKKGGEFDEDLETVKLRKEFKSRIDISDQIAIDFKAHYKKEIEPKLNDFLKTGEGYSHSLK